MANPGPASTVSAHPQQVSSNQSRRLLAVLKGVNVNALASFALPIVNSSAYLVEQLILTNLNNAGAAVTPTGLLATVSLAAGGASLFPAITPANLATPLGTSVGAASASATSYAGQQLYLNITGALATPIGATVDVYVYGLDFS